MSEFNKLMNKKAVALQYDDTKDAAPIIVASGSGYLAEKIIEVAGENNVPVYEDNSLASVLSRLDLGSKIPTELYESVVDIYVFFLNYSPKAKEHIKNQVIRDTPLVPEQDSNTEDSQITVDKLLNTGTVNDDVDSIEHQTRELLKELTISNEEEDSSSKAIPWLPEEF